MELKQIKNIIEAILMVADKPMTPKQLSGLFDKEETPELELVKQALTVLQEDYAERGVELKEVASGFRFQARADFSPWLRRMWEERPPKYGRAFLETLVLIAYRQPITRGEIEEVRGVAVSTQIIKTFIDRDWVKVVGHKEVPGRPELLATTKQFLDYFNLKSLNDLPTLAEVQDLEKAGEQLELAMAKETNVADADDAVETQQAEVEITEEQTSEQSQSHDVEGSEKIEVFSEEIAELLDEAEDAGVAENSEEIVGETSEETLEETEAV